MYKCPNCNYSTNEESSFCPQCGNRLVSAAPLYNEATEQTVSVYPGATAQPTIYADPAPADSEQTVGVYPNAAPQPNYYSEPETVEITIESEPTPVQETPAYTQPAAQPANNHNSYSAPQPNYYSNAPVQGPSLAKKIVSMALSIAGFAMSIFDFLYVMIFLAEDGAFAFGFSFGFGIFCLPLGIVGLVMSNSCRNLGDESTFTRLGKIFGLIAVILTAVSFFFGFIGLITY